ncbi:hypothetical protein [Streptomyces sp. NPDC005760]|uniref:hypothetical protein n=1 Tax=Streptomyces sp. NPDC005760 TaxID=3156718 RepID=UPI0033F65096
MAEIIEDPEVIRFTGPPAAELTLERLRSWYGSRSGQPDRLGLHRVELEVYGHNSRAPHALGGHGAPRP